MLVLIEILLVQGAMTSDFSTPGPSFSKQLKSITMVNAEVENLIIEINYLKVYLTVQCFDFLKENQS